MIITEEDCEKRRKVVLRDGSIHTLVFYNKNEKMIFHENKHPFHVVTCDENGRHLKTGEFSLDVIKFYEEE